VVASDPCAELVRPADTGNQAGVNPESPYGFTSLPTAMAGSALNDIESWLADRFLDT
jgi:hypothetical protein